MRRALWRSRKGTTEEAASTPPFLAIAAVLVLFSLALMARWFYLYFVEAPDTFDSYAKANLDRLSTEIETMLKESPATMESRVIPYSLIGRGPKVRSIVGINPRLSPPESEGCSPEGEIEFPNFCKRYACLCLCDGTTCTGKNACKAFKPGDVDADVRFVGIDQPYSTGLLDLDVNRFNTGRRLSTTEDPLRLDNLYELILYPYCESSLGRGWGLDGSEDTGYLYVEETRSLDGKYTYVLIARVARADEAIERREEAIRTGVLGPGALPGCLSDGNHGKVGQDCDDIECCNRCVNTPSAPKAATWPMCMA